MEDFSLPIFRGFGSFRDPFEVNQCDLIMTEQPSFRSTSIQGQSCILGFKLDFNIDTETTQDQSSD